MLVPFHLIQVKHCRLKSPPLDTSIQVIDGKTEILINRVSNLLKTEQIHHHTRTFKQYYKGEYKIQNIIYYYKKRT